MVDKGTYIFGDESVKRATTTDCLTSEDARVDGRFYIIPCNDAEELRSGGHALVAVLHGNLAVGILEVTVARSRAEVDPTTDVAVPEESVMLLVRVGFDNGGEDFSADFRTVSYRDRFLDLGMVEDVGLDANLDGTFEVRQRADLG